MNMTHQKGHPALWVPSVYFAEALPYSAVILISLVMFKDLGLTNTQTTLYTGWLGLPWVIKPIWSSIIDNLKTKRWWILFTQSLIACCMAAVAFSIQTEYWLQCLLAMFMLIAFASATHDISADGLYIIALNEHYQSAFIGIRNTFYRIGMLLGQGGMVALAGWFIRGGWGIKAIKVQHAWSFIFIFLTLCMIILACWHLKTLPKVEEHGNASIDIKQQWREFVATLSQFAHKPNLISALAFILLFRLPEGLLSKIVPLFMKSSITEGGLGLDNLEVGFVNSMLGVMGLLAGGILGGILVAKYGLKRCLWPLVLCFTLPDIVYLLFSLYQTHNLWIISVGVCFEQLGYGMGFSAYTLFLISFSQGKRSTAIFSICTAGQFLGGTVLPSMISGWLSDAVGYTVFFSLVMACCLITFAVTATAKIN